MPCCAISHARLTMHATILGAAKPVESEITNVGMDTVEKLACTAANACGDVAGQTIKVTPFELANIGSIPTNLLASSHCSDARVDRSLSMGEAMMAAASSTVLENTADVNKSVTAVPGAK